MSVDDATALTPTTLAGSVPDLFDAIEGFIRQNANFESSIVQKRVVDEIGAATDVMVAFAVPMQNALLSMDGALRWAMFWRAAIDRNDTADFPSDMFTADAAIRLITQVYDTGFQDAVLQYFEESDSSDDDEGDEGDDTDPEGGDGWTGSMPGAEAGTEAGTEAGAEAGTEVSIEVGADAEFDDLADKFATEYDMPP